MKRLLLILLSAILLGNSYSQNTESSFFWLNQVDGYDSKIRAKSPTQIVSVSSSIETGNEIFTFIKNADTMIYATVPYGYTINDFVVLDSCIFFCGKNILDSCGYIGIFDVTVGTLNIGGYRFLNIDKTTELDRIVAYSLNFPIKYNAVAIGKSKISGYKSCVVDLNNHLYNDWTCMIGMTSVDYITDIANMWDGQNGEIVTVGQSHVLNQVPNPDGLLEVYSPKMYIRQYKRVNILNTGMENYLNNYAYTSIRMSITSPFKVVKLSNNNIAVSTVARKSILQQTSTEGIEIKTINLDDMIINNIQFIDNSPGIVKEMTYFSNGSKLALLKESTSGLDEIFFANLSQVGTYSTSKIYRDNTSFNSIFSYDNVHFLSTGIVENAISPRLSVLQENVNNFSTSECVSKKTIQVSSTSQSIYPSNSVNSMLYKQSYPVEFEIGFATIYETTVNVKCINYYK